MRCCEASIAAGDDDNIVMAVAETTISGIKLKLMEQHVTIYHYRHPCQRSAKRVKLVVNSYSTRSTTENNINQRQPAPPPRTMTNSRPYSSSSTGSKSSFSSSTSTAFSTLSTSSYPFWTATGTRDTRRFSPRLRDLLMTLREHDIKAIEWGLGLDSSMGAPVHVSVCHSFICHVSNGS